jgi:hypothetical protein
VQVWDTVIDAKCPQSGPFQIVRCTAHQHVGAQCMTLYNLDNGDMICQSCPVYGTQPGACPSTLLPLATCLLHSSDVTSLSCAA